MIDSLMGVCDVGLVQEKAVSGDQKAVVKATVQKLTELTGQWNSAAAEISQREKQIEGLQGEIVAWQNWKEVLETQAKVCWDFAALHGFDLNSEYAKAQAAADEDVQEMIQAVVSPPKLDRSIRDFVLEEAKAAYPDPVHATILRQKLRGDYGMNVHEKTIGMTLYRLSQQAVPRVERRGRLDWYFVPDPATAEDSAMAGRLF
jgi:hypothetical protein